MSRRLWPGILCAAVALAAVAAAPGAASAAGCPDEDLVPDAGNLAQVESALLCAMNQERVANGAPALNRSSRLDKSADFQTTDMIRSHYLGHEKDGHPSLLARIRGYGYFNGAANGLYSENVGVGAAVNGTVGSLMQAWMASPGHRANLLDPRFRDVGIATHLAPPDPAFFRDFPSAVYTTDFGRRFERRSCRRRPRHRSGASRGATPRLPYCRSR